MVNRIINLRLGDKLLKEIDSIVTSETYESRTEFVKEALRRAVDERNRFSGEEVKAEIPAEVPETRPHERMGKHSVS